SHRLQQTTTANDVQIFIDGEPGRRKNALSGANLFRIKSGGFGKFQPAFDAALAGGVAVVIDHALTPGAAKHRIGAAGENDRILDWNDALVVVAIQGPGL